MIASSPLKNKLYSNEKWNFEPHIMMLGNNATYDIPAIVSQFCLERTPKVVQFQPSFADHEVLSTGSIRIIPHPAKPHYVLLNKQDKAWYAEGTYSSLIVKL